MLIACPSCSHTVMVTASSLGELGRQMHCPQCLSVWYVDATGEPCDPSALKAKPSLLLDAPGSKRLAPSLSAVFSARQGKTQATGTKSAQPDPKPAKMPRKMPQPGWAASLFFLLLASSGLLYGRLAIVRAVPQMAGFYAALGMPVNLIGLDLRNVTSRILDGAPQPVLAVQGEIANRRAETTPVPSLRLSIRDAEGAELYSWTTPAPKDSLGAGETVSFRARLAAPPAGGTSLLVRFAETGATAAAPVTAPVGISQENSSQENSSQENSSRENSSKENSPKDKSREKP